MSFDFKLIMDSLIQWAVANSGINQEGRHIWAFQASPEPKTPYVVLNIINGPNKLTTTDSNILNDDGVSYDVTGTRSFGISVNVYGKSAKTHASNLSLSLETEDVKQFFRSLNISLGSSSASISNITEILDTIWEERQNFDLVMLASYRIPSISNTIDKVIAEAIDEMKKGENSKLIIGG